MNTKRTPVKDRKAYPYIVFQVESKLRDRLRQKVERLKKEGKPNASMSAYVEQLIRKAV